jgi:hypothetical protein
MSLKSFLLTTTGVSSLFGGALLMPPPAAAGDGAALPAVDGVNWKVDGFGGSLADRSIGAGRGSLTVPFGAQFGLQVDGVLGSFDSRFFDGLAGHFFWRDPRLGMIGLYGSYANWDRFGGTNVSHFGGESEVYWDRWTLQGVAGIEHNNAASATTISLTCVAPAVTCPNTNNTLTQTITSGSRFFDQVNLAYYINDNWKAYIGQRYLGGKNALALGTEIGLPLGRGMLGSLFVEGLIGEHENNAVVAGLRVYFGTKDKPLIRRQREDDPTSDWLPASLLSITNKYSTHTRTWTCPPGEHITAGGACI